MRPIQEVGLTPRDTPSPMIRTIPADGFSVREFARTARGSHRADLRLDAYAAAPLDTGTLEVLALLTRLERSALSYLRSVLVTPTHADARVTAFLVTWAYEKYWVADALEQVLAAHPGHTPAARAGIPALRKAWRTLLERLEPIRESVVANLIGDDVIAVHLLTGAVDEWITQAAYRRLTAAATHPELERTLALLLEVKQRHAAFFATEATKRLEGSASAGRLARRRLPRTWLPLGAQHEPPVLVHRFLTEVVPGDQLAAIDTRLDGYPGLAGLGLMTRAVRRVGTGGRQ